VADHPNRHIREAIEFALSHGWTLVKSAPRAHAWGRILCPFGGRGGCIRSIYSTPRVPEDHAKDIKRAVLRCPHRANMTSEEE
jgi:hypothetical protein